MNAPDHLAQVRQLRTLSGSRPHDELIVELHIAAQRLESLIRNWLTFPPRKATITDVENTVEGVRRTLINLRAQEAGNDAA